MYQTCLDYDCPYKPHLITDCWYMCIWLLGSKWDDLLYIKMSTCIARLMTCMKQLLSVSNTTRQACGLTYLIFLFHQLYFLPVVVFNHAANSFIIIGLLLVLSQVTWPTFVIEGKHYVSAIAMIHLSDAQFPHIWQSWIGLGQAIHCCTHCWATWNQLEHSWVPTCQSSAL